MLVTEQQYELTVTINY